jgi:tRNA threonylcarbamoyladenosine biosynthesis protein TsaB
VATEECVCAPAEVPIPDTGSWQAAGSGWLTYGEVLGRKAGARLTGMIDDVWPRASGLLPIAAADFVAGLAVDAADAQPVYLRNRVVNK